MKRLGMWLLALVGYGPQAAHEKNLKKGINVEVNVIDEHSEKLSLALGISAKRHRELEEMVMEQISLGEAISVSLHKLSLNLKHPNELAYVGYSIGTKIAQATLMAGDGSGLSGMFGGMKPGTKMGMIGFGKTASGEIKPISSLEDLPKEIRDQLRNILGDDEGDGKKKKDDSDDEIEW